MALLKVGMRVKKVAIAPASEGWHLVHCLGAQGVIVGIEKERRRFFRSRLIFYVRYDGNYEVAKALAFMLSPLTDPLADAFIERMKKLGREPVTLTDKQLDEVKLA